MRLAVLGGPTLYIEQVVFFPGVICVLTDPRWVKCATANHSRGESNTANKTGTGLLRQTMANVC